MRRGVHVALVSKETDSVVGPQLSQLALECGLVYTKLSSWTYTFNQHNQVKKLDDAATLAEADFRGVGRRFRLSRKCVSQELA